MRKLYRHTKTIGFFILSLVLAASFTACNMPKISVSSKASPEDAAEYSSSTFAMDTIITQKAYGPSAEAAMQEVNVALVNWENQLSLYLPESDIARINAGAGKEAVTVNSSTAALLAQAVNLSAQSENSFAVTIAPLTKAWGIMSDKPCLVEQAEIDTLLPFINDAAIEVTGNTVFLPTEGMGLDLGGIAKGAACEIVKEIYKKHNIKSAYLSIGGNVYVHGAKPNGKDFQVGFRNPEGAQNAYLGSFSMTDSVIAISGSYERFTVDSNGKEYSHIIDPRTGAPVQSDIVSVGALNPDGAVADFYSTTLFVWGKERSLKFMENNADLDVILLDQNKNIYITRNLEDNFTLTDNANEYTVKVVGKE